MFLFLLFPFLAHAESVVVTATRTATPTSELPYSVGSVNGEEWARAGADPAQALSKITGLSFTAAGGPGQTRTLLLRGAKPEHTLVLVDGMVVNDPLSPGRTFDFSRIPVDEIERIEVLKGPQSVLYGSDAMGGVIHIITKKGAYAPRARAEVGSYQTGKAQVSYLGFHAGYEKSKGYSAADEREGNPERDGWRVWRLGGKKEFALRDDLSLQVQADYEDSLTDTDTNGGRGGDKAGTYTSGQQLLFRTEALYLHAEDLEFSTALSITTNSRDDNTVSPAYYKAHLAKLEQLARFSFAKHQLTLGLEGYQESGLSNEISRRRRFQGGAVFVQEKFGQRFHGTAGARLDLHSVHHPAPNARLGLGYWFVPDRWRMKSSVGTGYKAPSLFQTYSRFGSFGLRPERSLGADLGLEFTSEKWDTELTAYHNRFRDMIDFNSATSSYFNLRAARTYGFEWSLTRKFRYVTLRNAFTTLRSADRETGLRLYRRPVISNTVGVDFTKEDLYGASAQLRYVGRRDDVHPSLFSRQKLPPFAVINANAFYRLNREYKIFARGENLGNRHYQEISGYGVPEISGYAGVEASW